MCLKLRGSEKGNTRASYKIKNMPKSGFDFPKRPLFPLDPNSSSGARTNGTTVYNGSTNSTTFGSGTTSTGKRVFLYASRGVRVIQVNWKIFTSALAVTLLAIIWYYPVFFLFLLFVVYSLLLVVAGKSCKCINFLFPLQFRIWIIFYLF